MPNLHTFPEFQDHRLDHLQQLLYMIARQRPEQQKSLWQMLFGPNVQCEIAGSAEADWGIIMRVKSNISEKDRIELRRTLSVLEDMLCIFNNFDLSLRQKDAMKSIVATRSNELYARARDLDDLDQWMSAWQNEVVAIHRSLRRSRETVLQTLNTKADLLEADADQLVRKISGERVLVESC